MRLRIPIEFALLGTCGLSAPVQRRLKSLLDEAAADAVDRAATNLDLVCDLAIAQAVRRLQQNSGVHERAGARAPLVKQRLQLTAIPIAQLHDMFLWHTTSLVPTTCRPHPFKSTLTNY